MSKVIVTIQTSSKLEDIENLAQSIRDENPTLDVRASEDKRVGFGTPIWEIVAIFIALEIASNVISDVYEASKKWAIARLESGENKQPKFITIFGPEGVPVKATLIDANGNVEDKTDSQIERFKEVKIMPPTR